MHFQFQHLFRASIFKHFPFFLVNFLFCLSHLRYCVHDYWLEREQITLTAAHSHTVRANTTNKNQTDMKKDMFDSKALYEAPDLSNGFPPNSAKTLPF